MRHRVRRWSKMLAVFLSGQTLVQGLNLVTGFLLLRWLSVESYAQYSVALAFQGTASMLVDLGLTGSIVSMVGTRGTDPSVVGGYIKVARVYRGRMFWIISTASLLIFPLIVRNQPWSWTAKSLLLGSVLASVFLSAWSIYGSPLLIRQRLNSYYGTQLTPGIFRLGLLSFIHLLTGLSGWLATWVSSASTLVGGLLCKRASADLVKEPPTIDAEFAREFRRFLAPQWLGIVLLALQSQITISLAAWFGSSEVVASLGAYGRLGQIFAVFGALGGVIVTPLAARCPVREVPRRLGAVLIISAIGAALLFGIGSAVPSAFQLLVGGNYKIRYDELLLFLGTTSVTLFAGWLFSFSFGRKWVFFAPQITGWIAVIMAQVTFLASNPLTTTKAALQFNLLTYTVGLVGLSIAVIIGLRKDRESQKWTTSADNMISEVSASPLDPPAS